MELCAAELRAVLSLKDLVERDFACLVAPDVEPELRRVWERALLEPARAFLGRPGKQFRARLVDVAWRLANPNAGAAPPAELPLIIEILHAGSLIVDDVQDESERRRGVPSLHRIVGVPLAINTGNLMYCWALDLISRLDLPAERVLALHRAASAALLRCHQGQALDLSVRIHEIPQDSVPVIVATTTELKAGTLLELAAMLGALGAGAAEPVVDALREFGRALGSGLQMLDDLSGVLNPNRWEKALEDLRHSRPTWVWSWLAVDLEPRRFLELQREARAVAAGAPVQPLLAELAVQLRGAGKMRVHAHLQRALTQLRARLGPSAPVVALQQEIERLEQSYV